MSKPRLACRYIGESTGRQVLGLGVQGDEIERYVKGRGWKLVRHYVDAGESGATFERPAFRQVLGDLRTGLAEVVVVARLDRVGRNLRGLLGFIEDDLRPLGVELVSVAEQMQIDDPVMGKILVQILGALAELERDLIVERLTKKAYEDSRQPSLWKPLQQFGLTEDCACRELRSASTSPRAAGPGSFDMNAERECERSTPGMRSSRCYGEQRNERRRPVPDVRFTTEGKGRGSGREGPLPILQAFLSSAAN